MNVFILVVMSRDSSCGDITTEVQSYIEENTAIKRMVEIFDNEIGERGLDLTDPTNDGIANMNDKMFVICPYVGGDWALKGEIFKREVL